MVDGRIVPNMIKKYLAGKAGLIADELLVFIEQHSQEALALDLDCLAFLKEFVVSGKLYRGGLVFLGYDLFAQQKSEKLKSESAHHKLLLNLAMLVELTHSAFLLHDDVMDQDDLRRGYPTFHKLVSDWVKKQGLSDANRVGESLAVCLGDLLIFWGSSLLTQALLDFSDQKLAQAISTFFHREMEFTAWGQMDDVVLGASSGEINQELIMNVLSLKSGHYSVVNPLLLGAMISCRDQSQLSLLKQAALNLGIVFQVKDDLLSLQGDTAQTGKAVGSDIKENKKTKNNSHAPKLLNFSK